MCGGSPLILVLFVEQLYVLVKVVGENTQGGELVYTLVLPSLNRSYR